MPAKANFLQQQARFDEFVKEFNCERPHQALAMKFPVEKYVPSDRAYRGLTELSYPFHDRSVVVTSCGRVCIHSKKINISHVFSGQTLGLKEVEENVWLLSFMDYDLGYIDLDEKCLQPLENPFGAIKV